MYSPRILIAVAGLFIVITGCAESGLDKVVVVGTIKYKGQPIQNGQIRFTPLEGTKGPVSGGVIKDGKYIARGKGGVPLGTHRVEIRAYRPLKNSNSVVLAEGGASEQYIPGKYNGASNLQTTITSESSSHTIDFDLEE